MGDGETSFFPPFSLLPVFSPSLRPRVGTNFHSISNLLAYGTQFVPFGGGCKRQTNLIERGTHKYIHTHTPKNELPSFTGGVDCSCTPHTRNHAHTLEQRRHIPKGERLLSRRGFRFSPSLHGHKHPPHRIRGQRAHGETTKNGSFFRSFLDTETHTQARAGRSPGPEK